MVRTTQALGVYRTSVLYHPGFLDQLSEVNKQTITRQADITKVSPSRCVPVLVGCLGPAILSQSDSDVTQRTCYAQRRRTTNVQDLGAIPLYTLIGPSWARQTNTR